jgi:hypothetical protein
MAPRLAPTQAQAQWLSLNPILRGLLQKDGGARLPLNSLEAIRGPSAYVAARHGAPSRRGSEHTWAASHPMSFIVSQ